MKLFDEIAATNRDYCREIEANESADIYDRALSDSERMGRLSLDELMRLPEQARPNLHCILSAWHPARAIVPATETDVSVTFKEFSK